MILVDTSVWVDHLRRGNPRLVEHLEAGDAMCHPFVIGELACGSIRNRTEVLALLTHLPSVAVARHAEVLSFIDSHRLMGRGLGFVDAHLLASAWLERVPIWTLDRSLAGEAMRMGVGV